MYDISVRPRTDDDLEWVTAAFAARAAEVEALDPRVPAPRGVAPDGEAIVAVDGTGRPVGHVALTPAELSDDGEMAVWWPPRSVDWGRLWAADAAAAGALAIEARRRYPDDTWTPTVLAPTADGPTADLARVLGLVPISSYACRAGLLAPRPAPAGVRIRPATETDTETIVALLDEDLAFHVAHSAYVRALPAAEAGLRRRMSRAWSGEPAGARTPQLVVASVGDEVVGFTESWIEDAGEGLMVRPGRYGFVNTAAVAAAWRGRGVGRALTAATLELLDGYGARSFLLWFNWDNPLSSRIWPHVGFSPLWTAYLPAR